MTIPIDAGFAAMARPGDRCDLIFVVDAVGEMHTDLHMSAIRILATGTGARPTVTLALSPSEVGYVASGMAHGTPSLALRNPEDQEMVSLEKASLSRLITYFEEQKIGMVVRTHIWARG